MTPTSPDVNQLEPAIESIEATLDTVPEAVLAHAGYWSEANAEMLQKKGIEIFIATGKHKHGEIAPSPRGRAPKVITPREQVARTLPTRRGRKVYSRRKTIVEPVIGQIKQARGFRQFLRRGLEKVGEEWALVCLAHNLLKFHTALRLV